MMQVLSKLMINHRIMTSFLGTVILFCLSIAQATITPEQLVQNTSDAMLSALQKNKATLQASPEKIYGLVNEIVLPHLDFQTMAQWVMGKQWRQASAEQKQQFTQEFKTLLVRVYAGALLEYSDEKVRLVAQPATPADADETLIKSEITSRKGQPIGIHYSMHKIGDSWKVYDIVIEGISIVTNYRASISEEITNKGIDGMINTLAAKNASGQK